MLIATVPLLFAVIGLLMFMLLQSKWSQVGLAIFTAAMVAIMIVLSKHTVRLG